MGTRELILIAEDDLDIQEILQYNLKQDGFRTVLVSQGDQVFETAKKENPSLLILDLMLPFENGLEICKKMRGFEGTRGIPIIMLTAKGSETDKIVGLELGADDYVTKPFSPKELVARVKATLRRFGPGALPKEFLQKEGLKVHLKSYRVQVDEEDVNLTLTEYKLLKELMSGVGRVLSRQELVGILMGPDVSVTDRTIDVHLASLRKKIEPYSDHIETVRGVGYRFRE